ncbi:hypothetical protein EIN_184570 [Entamoeba invadens IP1]|uniref:hypothetical protein n=1 Tax=Entamoeba invadens IP1 TaxID=370355 RepID=UPI0002C3D30D|nr:hypothetical protein EIN_184570 [Entamoeba invadens IP1]ELP94100.1 hypothetical protein EIN_184570 [Entamoeba invadens IP1]|eukprot:XP_004260871.1 hypothetical protein EIN_184570 [Entamoeba invadens IP1]
MSQIDSVKPKFCPQCQRIMLQQNCGDDLYFVCRNGECNYYEKWKDPKDFCVYMKSFSETKTTTDSADVSKDPTYPKARVFCSKCDCEVDAVYYFSAHWNYNCSLQIFYKCTICSYSWAEGGAPLKKDK